MKALDGRHRWEVTSDEGARITHTCRVCGVSQTFEKLIPDALVEKIVAMAFRRNIYRDLFARVPR